MGNTLHLADQDYNICIRQEMGMTCTVYTVCAAIAGQGLPYSLNNRDVTIASSSTRIYRQYLHRRFHRNFWLIRGMPRDCTYKQILWRCFDNRNYKCRNNKHSNL